MEPTTDNRQIGTQTQHTNSMPKVIVIGLLVIVLVGAAVLMLQGKKEEAPIVPQPGIDNSLTVPTISGMSAQELQAISSSTQLANPTSGEINGAAYGIYDGTKNEFKVSIFAALPDGSYQGWLKNSTSGETILLGALEKKDDIYKVVGVTDKHEGFTTVLVAEESNETPTTWLLTGTLQ